jgi:hypothetical protein
MAMAATLQVHTCFDAVCNCCSHQGVTYYIRQRVSWRTHEEPQVFVSLAIQQRDNNQSLVSQALLHRQLNSLVDETRGVAWGQSRNPPQQGCKLHAISV